MNLQDQERVSPFMLALCDVYVVRGGKAKEHQHKNTDDDALVHELFTFWRR